ncbi:protein ENHANCED DISEASE RESISTANCE 4 [Lactuca sativa]|uniref:Zinc-ribbon domain-containing protein n=1 Tax=Lactuca sativa TaxID=4236 RepID=A0A9R1XX61_LACSA|nr:protein ENHANCED DISEASE RESISTANCE 4 [Lactuca sativa]KAJ0223802.1 hypothetical protein LSAT_V11C200097230 [Lactuca sativa]
MNTPLRLVRCPKCRKLLPESPDVPVYQCGGCGAVLQAKKRKNDTVDTAPRKLEEESSSGKLKMEQVSDDQKPSSSTNHSINEPNRKTSDHNDVHISSELLGQDNQDATAKKAENYTVDAVASNGVKDYSSGKQKMKQVSNDDEACSSSNQQSLVSSIHEPDPNSDRNDPRSSTELSGHGDPESSPEATAHNRKNQDQVHDHDFDEIKSRSRSRSPEAVVHDGIDKDGQLINNRVSENCENEVEFEDSSRELTKSPEKCSFSEVNEIQKPSRKPIADRKIDRDSNRGSKSSFKSLIAEKLLDTRQKKVVYMDEDDIPSEDGSADLCHRRRLFNRISSEETFENERFGGTSYEYEGSVSSFDGTDNQIPTKKHVDSVNEYHQKHHRREFHPSVRSRRGKDEHRSMQSQPFYGNAIPSRHRPPVNVNAITGNPKMERLELLKMVRELQDQLERTNVSQSAQLPSSYYYDHGLNHPRRYAFSGEVNRRRDGGSGSGTCHHCYPQPQEHRHFSAQQIPRPHQHQHQHVCCNGPHYVPSTCYSSESDFTTPEPDDIHRHRIDVPKPKPTYKKSPKKRYVRPISGGSPWIACYRCSEVLQLPQSFLVFKKRCHSLRCGACENVLNFTVSDGTHVHRYYPEEMMAAPPSSEVEDYGDVRAGLGPGPVSCSDISFQKSYSTETDRNGSREFFEERRKAGPSGPSSSSRASGRRKVISEIEEVEPGNNGSPLHWLMGYASPSKVIRG